MRSGDHSPLEPEAIYLLPVQTRADTNQLGLRDIVKPLLAGWYWLLLSAVSVGAMAFALSYLVKPAYRAEAVLSVTESSPSLGGLGGALGDLGGLAGLSGINLNGGSLRSDAIALLQSRLLVEELIRDKDLLPILFGGQWDAGNKVWRTGLFIREPTVGDGARTFEKRLRTVAEDRKTGLITLGIEWSDPGLAAEWVRELVTRVNQNLREKAIAESEAALEYLSAAIAKTDVMPLKEAAYRLTEQELKRIMLANVRPEYALRTLDPAVVPEAHDFFRPRRLMFGLVGAFLGILACAGLLLQRESRGTKPQPDTAD